MKTLRLLINESWPEQSIARWVLLGDKGAVLDQGMSEPRHWPPAERTEAILCGHQVGWHAVPVPRANAREQARAVPFALEEILVREPDSQHITASARGEEQWSVLVVGRERLRRLVAQCVAIQRPLDAAYASLQTTPLIAGDWSLAREGDSACVRRAAHDGFADDIIEGEHTPPMLLAAALAQAQHAAQAPAALKVFGSLEDWQLNDWPSSLGISVDHAGPWAWWDIQADTATPAANLLHDEFSPAHQRGNMNRALRPALALIAVLLLIDLGLGFGQAMLQRSRLADLKQAMQGVLTSALPNTPALNPPLQIRRALNTQRSQHGMLADDDGLSLMADLSSALGADANNAVQSLHFEGGTLEVGFSPGSGLDGAALVQRLATRQIRGVLKETTPVRIALRRAEP